ncbi:type IX secretion system motor protein PorL/GldL [Mangrovivirga cuniculi]|uniref:Gliding motility protein GldL n=1 Tax=Mangrovivirga cuniculi TaxID=2715131 RepID=A0A4D7JF96_9BACT|nr:gliding motility protein GldL [Mangrovivirga cuniculi]QCK13803.1 gliding motility protein GldL [Mangrovivirga cuniculi]
MSKKGGFSNLLYGTLMPKIYGIGGAIVIIGALFKILHLEGADIMLIVGLGTEALIFFLSAFEPSHEVDWARVYPELADDYDGPLGISSKPGSGSGDSVSKQLDKALESNKVGGDLVKSLGDGLKNLSESASKMADLSNAAVATNEYASNVKQASKSLTEMNKSYGTTMTAMSEMANAAKDAKEYHSQVQSVTKNLSALNAVYEMELQDANSHLKAMKKFYGNVATAMDSMAGAAKETESFKNELGKLTTNLTSLNNVYGSMLTAMRGSK